MAAAISTAYTDSQRNLFNYPKTERVLPTDVVTSYSDAGDETLDRDEFARLQYIVDLPLYRQEKAYEIHIDLSDIPPEVRPPQNNIVASIDYPKQRIRDLRWRENDFRLRDHGFQIERMLWDDSWMMAEEPETGTCRTGFQDSMTQWVEERYLREVEMLVTDVVERDSGKKVVKVLAFDWRIRSTDPRKTGEALDDKDEHQADVNTQNTYQGASCQVHIDQSNIGAELRVRRHCNAEADELLDKHFQLINVWRPMTPYLVEDYPLVLCDGSTTNPDEDFQRVDYVCIDTATETWYPMYRDHYRWYYLSQQSRDEVILLKMWDNDPYAPAKCCPHTSFQLQQAPERARPRESIEVRALVFSEW